jgi:hypothetical protein
MISWLILFKEITAVYTDSHLKVITTLCVQNADLLNFKGGGTLSVQLGFKVLNQQHMLMII